MMVVSHPRRPRSHRPFIRALWLERLEQRQLLAVDLDDSLTEAVSLGAISTAPRSVSASLSPDTDVTIYRFSVTAGQVVDFDIDTPLNGPGGLGSFLRLFNSQGQQLASNDDAIAPGENSIGFDSYLRFTFATAGIYFLGVSNNSNTLYNPTTGDGDISGGANATGNYQLIVQGLPVDADDSLTEANFLGAISTTTVPVSGSIAPDVDVDLYRFTVTAGQVVDFDIDTPLNGPGGLGSFLRLFNAQGQQLAANDDGLAPGENVIGFDSYLRFTFTTGGTYYLGVSNLNNTFYNPTTGAGDVAGGQHSIGDYQLTVRTAPVVPVDLDDSLIEANLLGAISTTPVAVSGSITPDVDVDLYRFSVTAGQVVDFDIDTTLNGPGGLGSFLRLFNAQGQQLASNDDAVAPGENVIGFDSYLRFTFTTAGTHYIGVSNNNNTLYNPTTGNSDTSGGQNATGNYQLIVQGLPVDTDDSLTEASFLGAISTTPVLVSGSITPDVDVDVYRFLVTAGQVVDFDIDTALNGPGGLGSFLRLFNVQGQQLASNDDAVAPGENVIGFDAYLRFTFITGGTYYLGVSNLNNTLYNPTTGAGDVSGGQHSIGDYQLTVQTAPVVPVDSDDSLTEAIVLGAISTTPVPISGSIMPDVDVDIYRFTVTAGQVVDFDIDTPLNGPGDLGSFLRLFNAQGQQLASNDDANAPGENSIGFDSYLRFTFATAGDYYLGVSNNNNTLYNPTTGGGDTSGGQNATGNYQLIVQGLPVDTDDSLTEASFLGAISTTTVPVSGSIAPDVDVDLYRFTVTAGQVVDFDIDTPLNGPGGLGSFLRLFNSQGQQLASNDDGVAPGENVIGFDSYLPFTFTMGGTYYVGVSNSNNRLYDPVTGNGDTAGGFNSVGTYQLNIRQVVVPAPDPDDTLAEANALGAISSTPVPVSASITPDTDVDLYRFAVTAGQVVDFDIDTPFNGPGGLGSFLRLFNAQGQQLASNNDGAAPGENTIGFDSYLRFTFTTAGTYYIGVANANNTLYDPLTGAGDVLGDQNTTGSYQLTVQALPVDTDDALSEATILGTVTTTTATINASILPDIDVDLYRFTANGGQTVDFDIDTALNGSGGLNSFFYLFNAQGNQIASSNDAAAPGESAVGFDAYLRFTFTTTGNYYIGVSNSSNTQYDPVTGNGDTAGGLNSIGTYQLSVQVIAPADPDDTLNEATNLGTTTTAGASVNNSITPDTDVDLYRFTVAAGQVVDFDLDTTANGAGGLNSFLTLFNAQGQSFATNNNAAAPGENVVGFDAYLRFTFATAGTYYIGVSNANNTLYNPTTGAGDVSGGPNATGNYQLIVQALPVANPALTLTTNVTSIPEANGTAIGTVVRSNTDTSQSLLVTLGSSDGSSATVPPAVVIAANQASTSFIISAVHDTTRGTRSVTITAGATGYTTGTTSLLVTDSDLIWHNASLPSDVDNDRFVSPIDALLIINFLNARGAGPVPIGEPPPYLDVDADNFVSPSDVVTVINELNADTAAFLPANDGEGEQISFELSQAESNDRNHSVTTESLAEIIALLAFDVAEQTVGRRQLKQ